MVTLKDGSFYCTQEDFDNGELTVDENCNISILLEDGTKRVMGVRNGDPLVVMKASGFSVKLFDADSRTFK